MDQPDSDIYVFLGPTLDRDEARLVLDARYLPPVSQGDVYAAALERPRAIAIVDGYFEQVPSVWHKEILWALAEGIHVFGAASMGALRAVELETYGMVGVGRIFEDFRSGLLQDDDEVAMIHGPAESGFLALSEAMVDIRATLDAAARQGIFDDSTHHELVTLAKSLFYPERAYARLLTLARARPHLQAPCARLEAWLPTGRVRQKRADALELLRLLNERRASLAEPKKVRFFFNHTALWESLRQQRQPHPPDHRRADHPLSDRSDPTDPSDKPPISPKEALPP